MTDEEFKDRPAGRCLGFALGLLVTAVSMAHAAQRAPPPDAAVTQLADAFVAEYERRFPFAVIEAGLELKSQSGININAPADLARWRRFVRSIGSRLTLLPESAVAGTPAWVTHAFLRHVIAQQRSYEICRSELWDVSPYGWAFRLRAIAEAQPVKTARDRQEALKRWERLAAWIDQDAANLAVGLSLGYRGLGGAVESDIAQIDALLAAPSDQWPTATLAKRASNPEFTERLSQIRTQRLVPAAKRYREFLSRDYLPKARSNPAITNQPLGIQCLRSRLSVATTVDMDPKTMFETVVARRKAEHARLLELGGKVYGVTGLDWPGLVRRVLNDPRSRFRDAEDIRSTLEQVMARTRAALPRMLMNPPSGEIRLSSFPAYAEATSPAGQLLKASDDGSRPATFLYRANPSRFSRVTAESLTMHEAIPGHYLQTAFLAEGSGTKLHAVSRLVYAQGPSEGWATYAESWAEELGLYSSPFDEMGGFMNSVTPAAVADLGMQVMGWDMDQAAAYLAAEMPFSTRERAGQAVKDLAGSPGGVEAYPIGVLQYEAARKSAQKILGSRFDSREYHQMLLSEGALPFAALNSKVARWVAAHH